MILIMRAVLSLIFLVALTGCAATAPSDSSNQKLLGKHGLSLQWIGWEADEMGEATITRSEDGTLAITGRQDAKQGGDYLTISGTISDVGSQFFTFHGRIVTQVSHIAGGNAVVRDGTYRFGIYGNRDYWRMEQLDNPEDGVVDYIDIHF